MSGASAGMSGRTGGLPHGFLTAGDCVDFSELMFYWKGLVAAQLCLFPRQCILSITSFLDFRREVDISNSYVKSGDF